MEGSLGPIVEGGGTGPGGGDSFGSLLTVYHWLLLGGFALWIASGALYSAGAAHQQWAAGFLDRKAEQTAGGGSNGKQRDRGFLGMWKVPR